MIVLLCGFVITLQMTIILTAVPPIQKCKMGDEACLKTVAQSMVATLSAGISEMETEPLDVMHVDHIKVDLAGLNLNIREADIKGLKKAIIDKISIDMAKKEMLLRFHTDVLLKGQYQASGRLLILPITGDGDTTIKLKNLQIEMTMPFEIIKDVNGKDIINLKSYKYKYDVKNNANFYLTNLFNGNKILSDTMHTFMNENWKALTHEFGIPMLEKPNAKIFDAIKKYLKSQPLDNVAEY